MKFNNNSFFLSVARKTVLMETLIKEAEGSVDPQHALSLYHQVIASNDGNMDDATVRLREMAILKAGEIIQKQGDAASLDRFVRSLESKWNSLPRAKAARLIRTLLDLFDSITEAHLPGEEREAVRRFQMFLCRDLLDWATRDNRAFLRQSLQLRLAGLYLENRLYGESLALVSQLQRDLKKMDDKLTLVEVHLLECRIYFQLRNGPKAKAALTAARSNSNAVYCPPLVQAALDMQSGMVYADESDFKTAYSYFVEALDSYASQGHPRGSLALKYMLLCKIMMQPHHEKETGMASQQVSLSSVKPTINEATTAGKTDEFNLATILERHQGKNTRYALDPQDLAALQAVASAYRRRSLRDFELALSTYPTQLGTDPMIHQHFQNLYEQLLTGNLLRLVAPYSRVQLAHISQQIDLPIAVVEAKLSIMILDGKLSAIIDQHAQCLIMVEKPIYDQSFVGALETIKHLDGAFDALYQKATKIA